MTIPSLTAKQSTRDRDGVRRDGEKKIVNATYIRKFMKRHFVIKERYEKKDMIKFEKYFLHFWNLVDRCEGGKK